jgi:uncharacterized protein YoaH (UPF0181 family)
VAEFHLGQLPLSLANRDLIVMKRHSLIASVLLASFVVGSSLPVDSTAIGSRDTSTVLQSLKSFDVDPSQLLSDLSEGVSSGEAIKSTGDELLVGRKKNKSKKASKKASKKKKKNQKNKGKKVKASPTKTKKQ